MPPQEQIPPTPQPQDPLPPSMPPTPVNNVGPVPPANPQQQPGPAAPAPAAFTQPAPQPPVMPEAPTPPPQPNMPGMVMGGPPPAVTPMAASMFPPANMDKKRPMKLILIIALVLLFIGGGVFAATKLAGGIKLEEFSNSDFSILRPTDYEKKESGGTITFEEKGGDDETHSAVIVLVEEYPEELSDEELEEVVKFMEDNTDELVEQMTAEVGSSAEITDVKIDKTTINGEQGFRIDGKIEDDGNSGDFNMHLIITKTGVYVVQVAAHSSDKAFAKKADEILDSFDIK